MNPNDPDVIALSKAIIQHESGGDFNAVGDAGTSHGAAQWQPATWKAQAKDVLGDENAAMTPEHQKAVLQVTVAKRKAAGLNPAQIAAEWNSGQPDGWENKIGVANINGQRIPYNVPKYVKDVTDLYHQYKGQGGSTGNAQSPNSLIQGDTQQSQAGGINNLIQPQEGGDLLDQQIKTLTSKAQPGGTSPGFFQGLAQDLNGTNPESIGTQIGNTIKGAGDFFAPSVGDAYHLAKGDNTKTGLQLAGDLGSTALSAATLIPGVGEAALGAKAALTGAKGAEVAAKVAPTLGSQVLKNGALGAAFGASGALGAGETDPGKIAESTAIGAGTGGLLGGAAAGLSKAAEFLPQRLVQGVIKNSNPDVAQYALTKKMGSPAKMLAESDASLKTIGSDLGAALKDSKVDGMLIPSEQIVPSIIEQFPNAELSPEALQVELGKIAPLQKGLITKLFSNQGLTIDELHTLNSAIGQNTYKMAFDDPMVKAGKDIGNAFYQTSKDIITKANPDTIPLFDQYSKEIQLNQALNKAAKRGAKTQVLTLRDIISMLGGYAALGPGGAVGGYLLEKAGTSPTVNMKAAGLLNSMAGKDLSKLTSPATLGATGLLNQAVQGRN